MFTRIYYIKIIFQCFFRRITKGCSCNEVKKIPKTVLIVQLAWLGDMVCTTPMFSAIRKEYPNCRIVVIGASRNKELLENHLDVDRYISWKDNFRYIKEQLRKESVDFACVTSPHFLSLAYLYLIGIPSIAVPQIYNGFSPLETKSFRLLRSMVAIKVPHKMGSYAPREYLRLLEPIGIISDNTKKTLYFSKKAKEKVYQFFLDKNITSSDLLVAISPSVGNKIKKWKADKFAKLADDIYHNYDAKLIIIGGEGDKEEVEEMISFLGKDTLVFNTLGIFSIDELKALISKIDFFISVDTGPIYIAEAFGVATVDITGPIDENEQPPISDIHRVVNIKNRNKPELYVMNSRVYNREEALRQVDEISVEMVLETFDEIFHHIKQKRL